MEKHVLDAAHTRISDNWKNMDVLCWPSRNLLGDNLTVLDFYVTVVSRFGHGAGGFAKARIKWRKRSVVWKAIRMEKPT